ncbi:type II toxin-antitoxin system PemK/MazF family toxin [Algoriphagus chordae]|uniref:mRNA interferase MazF n=1 Tax=Algoriphagus chordae TaxID=237019 RepID=A0A2W7QJZ6_9BACT|nr:type II toxin-antitoxin system PemK/MazF family toxin [Algoriphagus chordae]PZX48431.1 mRNA interferase MazF [Algoriphagus chordae]
MGTHLSVRGKIVLVPFPFDDFSLRKVRPALCLSDPIGKFEHIVVAFISSKAPEILEESDILIDPQEDYWAGTGLLVASVLRLHKIVSIPLSLIMRELGSFPLIMDKLLAEKIKSIFQLK